MKLHKIRLLLLTFLMGGFVLSFSVANAAGEEKLSPAVLIALTNTERVKAGLPVVKESATLNEVARLKAEDMAKQGYFAHTSPQGKEPWFWFKAANYKYLEAGENLAILFNDEQSLIKAWMNSPTHRENILKDKYTEIGMAVVTGNYNGVQTDYVVEVFGKPNTLKASAPKVVTNSRKVKRVSTVKSYQTLTYQK